MAGPSVTYSFSNSTTADASQVNQNFTDIINGVTDGTKDLSINALTCAGAASLNGNVTLGNASSDDVTITGSLASSVGIKTTFSYDFGSSTVGIKSIYFGSNDSAAKTTRVIAGAVGTSHTLTLPTDGGTSRDRLETNGSGAMSWVSVKRSGPDAHNVGISASVATNALTIALKGANGSDPSSTNPVDVVFRNSTATTGQPVTRTVTSALSLVISSGSTLGHTNNQAQYIYVYLIDNAGTVELAASSMLFDEGSLVSTTGEGGAGGADSNRVMYSSSGRANVACRLIGRLLSTQATAGTWASSMTEVSVIPFQLPKVSLRYENLAGSNITSSVATKVFETYRHDNYGAYSQTTGIFTAPRAGVYRITTNLYTASIANTTSQGLQLNYLVTSTPEGLSASSQIIGVSWGNGASHAQWIHASKTYRLAAGDTIEVQAANDSTVALSTTAGRNYVCIEEI